MGASRSTRDRQREMCQAGKSSELSTNITHYWFSLPWHYEDFELAEIHNELNRLMNRLYAYTIMEDNDD